MAMDFIKIQGAREHNLKNVSLSIPKGTMTVFTGVSGSGKSSLAFDTLFAEGQRKYVESLSAYARQFLGQLKKPDVDRIDGLAPAIAIEQKTVAGSPSLGRLGRSLVTTMSARTSPPASTSAAGATPGRPRYGHGSPRKTVSASESKRS